MEFTFAALSVEQDRDDEHGNPVVSVELSREQAEALFEELFVALVPPLSTEGDRE